MALHNLILDAWASLGYKTPLKEESVARSNGWEAKSWLPHRDRRRLAAYTVLAAYEANTARAFIPVSDTEDKDENREYGDAALIIDQVLAHLLGETQEIVVPGAEDYDPDAEVSDDEDEEAAGIDLAKAKMLAERQEFLRDWAEKVHLTLRLVDGERNAVQYGDAVYLQGWDAKKKRVTCAALDPGFYFPVLPDSIDSYEYPTKVHFAWELPEEDFSDNKRRLRRLTYELRPLVESIEIDEESGEPEVTLPADAYYNSDGLLVREYPWDEDPSTLACYLTDATWILDDTNDADIDALSIEKAKFKFDDEGREVRDLDLGIDFLPIVHVPNTPPGGQHFGQATIARVLQILDDLQNADTDAQKASATAGSPIIGVSGSKIGGGDPTVSSGKRRKLTMGAGELWELGENGSLDVVDTSKALAELRNFVESLRDRLATNSRLPAAVLGTVDPSEVPSGYAMELSFGPLTAMIRQMRLVRDVKHGLLMKHTQRLFQANDELPKGETPPAAIRLGTHLPSDKDGTLKLVVKGIDAKVLSLETGIGMLVDVGIPIDDIGEEIARIKSMDFERANELADATGALQDVLNYLGIDRVAEESTPPVPLPEIGDYGFATPPS